MRRATSDRWKTIGPRLAEMSEIAAEGKARDLAHIYPAQEFAIANITKIYAPKATSRLKMWGRMW